MVRGQEDEHVWRALGWPERHAIQLLAGVCVMTKLSIFPPHTILSRLPPLLDAHTWTSTFNHKHPSRYTKMRLTEPLSANRRHRIATALSDGHITCRRDLCVYPNSAFLCLYSALAYRMVFEPEDWRFGTTHDKPLRCQVSFASFAFPLFIFDVSKFYHL